MAEKKHPILTVLVILGVIALILGSSMFFIIRMIDPASDLTFADRIGVIPIDGAILDSYSITSQLINFRKDDKIKAIVLRINSPGGAVGPVQDIYREIKKPLKPRMSLPLWAELQPQGDIILRRQPIRLSPTPGPSPAADGAARAVLLICGLSVLEPTTQINAKNAMPDTTATVLNVR